MRETIKKPLHKNCVEDERQSWCHLMFRLSISALFRYRHTLAM